MPIRFMNRSLMLLLLLIGMQPMLYAQLDTNQETFRIKALALERNPLSDQFPLTLSPIVGLTDKGFEITMGIKPIDGFAKKKYGMTQTRDVVDPTWEIKQQFNENRKNVSKYDRDYYLGDIKTKSKYIRILCRDHEYEDGDRIKLMLNKAIIHPNITLRNSAYIIDIELKEGLNTIQFIALNEGSSSPNTAHWFGRMAIDYRSQSEFDCVEGEFLVLDQMIQIDLIR
jgi:hypothetical protein